MPENIKPIKAEGKGIYHGHPPIWSIVSGNFCFVEFKRRAVSQKYYSSRVSIHQQRNGHDWRRFLSKIEILDEISKN